MVCWQATWQAAANSRTRSQAPRRCNQRDRDDVVAVARRETERASVDKGRERGSSVVCVVLGLVVGAMKVVSE